MNDTWQWFEVEIASAIPKVRIRFLRSVDALLDSAHTERLFELDGYMPYYAALWPASIALARELAAHRDRFQGTRILELGCGLGLVSIAAAKLGLAPVATDYIDDALEATRANAVANGLADLPVRQLDWRERRPARWARIVAADVLYEQRFHAEVAAFMAAHLDPAGFAWIADPCRTLADAFSERGRAAGLEVTERSLGHVEDPAGGTVRVRVFEVRIAVQAKK